MATAPGCHSPQQLHARGLQLQNRMLYRIDCSPGACSLGAANMNAQLADSKQFYSAADHTDAVVTISYLLVPRLPSINSTRVNLDTYIECSHLCSPRQHLRFKNMLVQLNKMLQTSCCNPCLCTCVLVRRYRFGAGRVSPPCAAAESKTISG